MKLLPTEPPVPCQFSSRTQSLRIFSIRLLPATLPSAVFTSQSPTQKSNWRYSGAEQGAGGGAFWAAAAAARSSDRGRATRILVMAGSYARSAPAFAEGQGALAVRRPSPHHAAIVQ